jgi:Flp pilus assembly protein TadB
MVDPVLLFVYLLIVQPGYLEPMLRTNIGKMLMVIAVILLFVGNFVMNKIAELDY